MVSSLAFNLLMLAADVALCAVVRWRRDQAPLWALGCGFGAVAIVLGAILGDGFFGVLRLWTYAVFVHVPLVALAVSALHPRPRVRIAGALSTLSVVAIGADAFLIEPQALEVTRVSLISDKLERPLRIVVIADLQTDRVGEYERHTLERAVLEKPDLVLLPGDYIQGSPDEWPRLAKLLAEVGLAAPLGVYAVQGNVDADGWPQIFTQVSAEVFTDTRTLRRPELAVTGLSLGDSFDPNLQVAVQDRFHIAFGHAPDFALGRVDADLLVAGHTHGGQVRLPLIGPLLTLSHVPRAWAAGVTELSGGRTLVVSRGVGMERGSAPRLRFLCRPELVVIEVTPR
jgi:predicted MPP superfamily phosphohydrolase